MAKKHGIYVFSHDAQDLTGTGLVGDLKPLEATFTEEKNGVSEVEIRMPYDQFKKWQACKVGNIIKAEVPVRVPPVIDNDEYANNVEVFE